MIQSEARKASRTDETSKTRACIGISSPPWAAAIGLFGFAGCSSGSPSVRRAWDWTWRHGAVLWDRRSGQSMAFHRSASSWHAPGCSVLFFWKTGLVLQGLMVYRQSRGRMASGSLVRGCTGRAEKACSSNNKMARPPSGSARGECQGEKTEHGGI